MGWIKYLGKILLKKSRSFFIYPFAEERSLGAVGQSETTGGLDTNFP